MQVPTERGPETGVDVKRTHPVSHLVIADRVEALSFPDQVVVQAGPGRDLFVQPLARVDDVPETLISAVIVDRSLLRQRRDNLGCLVIEQVDFEIDFDDSGAGIILCEILDYFNRPRLWCRPSPEVVDDLFVVACKSAIYPLDQLKSAAEGVTYNLRCYVNE